ncbi:MAG: hypothetical protein ABIH00_07145 [Armatimonadota bacterium]
MKPKSNRKTGEYFFQIPTDANKDLGAFLLFLGIIGSAPIYYLASLAIDQPTLDLRPAIWIGAFFVVLGLYFIMCSKKSFWVSKNKLVIKDSFFKKKLTYKCDFPDKAISLKSYEIEYRAAPVEIWQVFLTGDKKEFLIHKKANAQLEMRQLAETLAKILECPFQDLAFEDEGITINSSDLDLPYKDRVLKYPQLLGKAIKKPQKVYFTTEQVNNNLIFSWGIMTPRLLMDILFISGIMLLLSIIPCSRGGHSFFEICVMNKQFWSYYIFAGIIIATVFILSGYKVSLVLTPKAVNFNEYIWAITYRRICIEIDKIEEINTFVSIRGAKVQIISDKKLIDIHIYNQENARWLVYQIRQYLMNA